jgi:hypothetical protein
VGALSEDEKCRGVALAMSSSFHDTVTENTGTGILLRAYLVRTVTMGERLPRVEAMASSDLVHILYPTPLFNFMSGTPVS